MKKFFLLFLVLGFCSNMFAQDWKTWDESTRDVAYETPNSALIKKWTVEDGTISYTFNANGTCKFVYEYTTPLPELEIDLKISANVNGTWKRNKQFLTITCNFANAIVKYNKEAFSKFPLRRQDAVKSVINGLSQKIRQPGSITEAWEILKLDQNALILGERNASYWSENNMRCLKTIVR